MSWSVDSKLYRNTSAEAVAANRPPWRPMTYRLIFRTNNGTNPGMSVPDAHIYIRRISYAPLPPAVPPGLLQGVWWALAPTSGVMFWVRVGVWGGLWLAGAFYLRDGVAAAREDAAAVAAWERERASGAKSSSRGRGRVARDKGARGDGEGEEAEEEEDGGGGGASAGTPLQPLRRAAAAGDYGAADAGAVAVSSAGRDAPAAALHLPRVGAGGAAGSRMARMRLLTDDAPAGMMAMQH
jgi:hypothetical protein